MRRAVFAVLAFALPVIACGKKGLPEECERYLAHYDCFLAKSGMTDRAATVDGIRDTWTTASKTPQGRSAILQACLTTEAQMDGKFRTAGCADVVPSKR
jgi:hypothetical protein